MDFPSNSIFFPVSFFFVSPLVDLYVRIRIGVRLCSDFTARAREDRQCGVPLV